MPRGVPETSSTLLFRLMVDALVALGLDVDRILDLAGLSRDQLNEPQGRLPARSSFSLWEATVRVSGDPAIGLRVGAHLSFGGLGIYEYLLRNTATLRQVIERADRFMKLLDDTARIEIVEGDEIAAIRIRREGGRPFPPCTIETLFTAALAIARKELCLQRPLAVRFAHAAPTDIAVYTRHFGCPVVFDTESHEIRFPAALLGERVAHADPNLGRVLEEHTEQLLSRLPDADPFVLAVRGKILELLNRGKHPTVALVARAMHTSERTLRRRLEAERTSYMALFEDLRAELARHYVARTRATFDEIAERLSFADSSAFYRAFRRWTGTTPALFRRSGSPSRNATE